MKTNQIQETEMVKKISIKSILINESIKTFCQSLKSSRQNHTKILLYFRKGKAEYLNYDRLKKHHYLFFLDLCTTTRMKVRLLFFQTAIFYVTIILSLDSNFNEKISHRKAMKITVLPHIILEEKSFRI